MSSSFNRITVLGAGVLGAQISFQIAYSGFEVTTYDISDAALKQARQRFDGIAAAYPTEVAGATEAAAQETIERIRFTSELPSAVQGADLVIEAVPENLELKRDVFARIAAFAPPAAVVVTNSSTLLPSDLMDSTGRPDRFSRCGGQLSRCPANTPARPARGASQGNGCSRHLPISHTGEDGPMALFRARSTVGHGFADKRGHALDQFLVWLCAECVVDGRERQTKRNERRCLKNLAVAQANVSQVVNVSLCRRVRVEHHLARPTRESSLPARQAARVALEHSRRRRLVGELGKPGTPRKRAVGVAPGGSSRGHHGRDLSARQVGAVPQTGTKGLERRQHIGTPAPDSS